MTTPRGAPSTQDAFSRRSIQQDFQVHYRYPVIFTRSLFNVENTVLRQAIAGPGRHRVLVIVDEGVTQHHPLLIESVGQYFAAHDDALELAGLPVVLPGGEQIKLDPKYVQAVQAEINAHGIDRHSYVMVIGGGAIIDMVGYAAATAHRGVRLLRVPTTVLSQNDSAVGVKNSVNAFGKKNFLGTFAPPHAVLNDLDFLTTLEERDWSGGLSEAVKVALLKDPEFFVFLEEHAQQLRARDLDAMAHAVFRCAELHVQHIGNSGDPFEAGSSRPLDFGHWAAHKLEALTHHALRHGEAVAVGIALDSTYAYLVGMLPESDWKRILGVLEGLGLPVFVPELETEGSVRTSGVLAGLQEFREHLGGRLTVTLLEGIGRPVEVHEMDLDVLRESVGMLKNLHTGR
ncbi:3-dehydroquinate synthase [Deinococcus malanensis]|uniref:3-dehydroquinate synthase n=1 Tax=Deinococcus malanensis TaxID=1706855 RepID=A0ABQ2EZV5_9DEIO|nr:3-dehydroquinate synthase [Deinococcus malanensis]GGK33810.1 3-dehydroquinate synthase [Deinococcus malanensis]